MCQMKMKMKTQVEEMKVEEMKVEEMKVEEMKVEEMKPHEEPNSNPNWIMMRRVK
jgi:hypothetical protein